MKKALLYVLLVLGLAMVATATGFTTQQVFAIAIFSGFIFGTLLFWEFRLAFALAGIALLLASGMLDVAHLIEFASLDVILFLVGMMILIGYLEERHFFNRALDRVLPFINQSATKLMTALMIIAFVSAAFVDEVTSILFMAAITLRIAKVYRLNPVPFIIMVVFATNIGSSATVVGNPIGVLIAMRSGFAFPDFLRWASPISILALIVTMVLSFIYFRKPMMQLQSAIDQTHGYSDAAAAKEEPGESMVVPTILFIGTILGLLLHKVIEEALGLDHNVMLVGVALLAAGIVLFLERHNAKKLVETRVDWWTLSFFMLLFASAGTLQYVGVTEHIAKGMLNATDGNLSLLFVVVTWSIGILSAFMDNVLAVASYVPVVADLAETVNVAPLWWGMLMGGTILGNLTFIGSTANIVAIGMLEKEEKKGITFMEWFWPGLVTSVPSLLLATILLYVQIPLMV